jgi:hypothetical protein
MGYRTMGRAHASLAWMRAKLRESGGQGTVEYVALMLLVAGILGAVVLAGKGLDGGKIAQLVSDKIKDAVSGITDQKG